MSLPFPSPTFLSPEFIMSRCTPADIDALAVVYYDAFKSDAGNSYWWSPDKSSMLDWMGRRVRRKMADRGVRHFKITDVESGDLIAWARWDIPENSSSFGDFIDDENAAVDATQLVQSEHDPARQTGETQEVAPSASIVESTPASSDYPEGANPALCRGFFDALARGSAEWHTGDMLAPKYHRRGAAKALLLPMLAVADAAATKAYLEATPVGKPIYEKLGFRQVDTVNFDLGKLNKDLSGVYSLSIMIREPKASRQ
ncbi:hypothetical protein BJ170DRAFT_593814 [Xylariales sp. AK1849]|nr:hypothetical protein BJ170DRAFT_593814 [Xylariales sp. AK1849]